MTEYTYLKQTYYLRIFQIDEMIAIIKQVAFESRKKNSIKKNLKRH
ncbi:MAG: hypothetical protein K8Q89_10915 [Nitrosarchaeum sp.]|nr:hypothetical protein [Nitrosarchaeum sp.]